MRIKRKPTGWGEWCWTPEMNIVQIHGTDGYMVGRVRATDLDGNEAGLWSRNELELIDLQSFDLKESLVAGLKILQEAKDTFFPAVKQEVALAE